MLRKNINLSIVQYIKHIYVPIILTVITSIILPLFIHMQFEDGWLQFLLVCFACVISVGFSGFIFGLTKTERIFFIDKGLRLLKIRE